MKRLLAAIAVLAALTVVALSSAAGARPASTSRGPRHLLHPVSPPLPHSLTVDEQEWSIILSEKVVGAGAVHFTDYNRGMDEHDLVIKGPGLDRPPVYVMPGQSTSFVAHLKRGTYVVYCSMFMGTPESHYMLGMHTTLTVR